VDLGVLSVASSLEPTKEEEVIHPSMMTEIARQHIEDLHDEASVARIARLARERNKRRSEPRRYVRSRLRNAPARQ
jgi:hypothetical protein